MNFETDTNKYYVSYISVPAAGITTLEATVRVGDINYDVRFKSEADETGTTVVGSYRMYAVENNTSYDINKLTFDYTNDGTNAEFNLESYKNGVTKIANLTKTEDVETGALNITGYLDSSYKNGSEDVVLSVAGLDYERTVDGAKLIVYSRNRNPYLSVIVDGEYKNLFEQNNRFVYERTASSITMDYDLVNYYYLDASDKSTKKIQTNHIFDLEYNFDEESKNLYVQAKDVYYNYDEESGNVAFNTEQAFTLDANYTKTETEEYAYVDFVKNNIGTYSGETGSFALDMEYIFAYNSTETSKEIIAKQNIVKTNGEVFDVLEDTYVKAFSEEDEEYFCDKLVVYSDGKLAYLIITKDVTTYEVSSIKLALSNVEAENEVSIIENDDFAKYFMIPDFDTATINTYTTIVLTNDKENNAILLNAVSGDKEIDGSLVKTEIGFVVTGEEFLNVSETEKKTTGTLKGEFAIIENGLAVAFNKESNESITEVEFELTVNSASKIAKKVEDTLTKAKAKYEVC